MPASENEPLRVLAQGRYLRLVANGRWEWVERTRGKRAVVIAAVTDQREMIFVEQFREPLQCQVIELPAGLIGDQDGREDEDLLEGARRELLEETGYAAGRVERLADCPTSPGLSTETVTFVRASELTRMTAGGGDEHENITVHRVPLNQCQDWLAERIHAGTPVAAPVFAGIQLWSADKNQGKSNQPS